MPHDAEEVLRNHLPTFDTDDFISWSSESNGIFSVRSAYRLAIDEEFSINRNLSHNVNGDRKPLSTIWKANVPLQVRVFVSRLATNALAVQ
jgi:hypothetical protein